MIFVDPAHPAFERLSKEEQARIYRRHLGWNITSLAEEFNVSRATIRRWTTPGTREKDNARRAAFLATERGRALNREYVRTYRARLKERQTMRNAD